MSNIPYAETILNQKKTNQWFVQFFRDSNGEFDTTQMQAHFNWFTSHLVRYTMVTSIGAPDTDTGFFHVNFVDESDLRLQKYQAEFEDADGVSLQPTSYQMYEWDYNNWVERGGPLEFADFEKNKSLT